MKQRNLTLPLLMACGLNGTAQERPNIIIINIDDMGYSDPSCFGGQYAPTPNIDRMADEGIRFTQFYTSCPISSPSRTGLTTGMYPTRWGINTFLQDRAGNAVNEQNDFLNNRAPSMARALKANGYVTGHFGKWHMGGGRDVKNAPAIPTYGFDEYASTWESPDPDPKLTSSNWIWAASDEVKRWNRTAYFVDKTLDFLSRHKGEPCFVNLWPDDVHTPWVYENDESDRRESAESFTVVLKELDVQIGRLMDGIKSLGIDNNTLVIFTSDNGPAPAFDGHRTNSFRGQKGTLYEGGIHMPFIVRWPGTIAPGQVNDASVMCTVDLFPSLCALTGTPLPTDYTLDGVDMSSTLLGREQVTRTQPLFWEHGKTKKDRVSPHIAVREGDWKLLVNADGSRVELYNMATDILEQYNVATANPGITARLKEMAIDWYNVAYREYADNVIRVAVDGDAEADGSSWEKATTIGHAVELSKLMAGTQIWMKSGIYAVTSSVNVDNAAFYGGFDGTETRLAQRDWVNNRTVVDGGGSVSPLRNSSLEATVSTVLDGLTVQNGINHNNANGNGNGGAAILTSGAQVRNCIFRNNRTRNGKNGAAIHCHLGNVRIENSLFVNNTSSGNGGAVQVGGSATATVVNCTFSDNVATGPGGAFGLGNETSNLNVYNTIAYHNTGKGTYSSFGQNASVDGGGKVVSKYSAIESVSKKFDDGDDTGHMTLSDVALPGFVNPSDMAGATDNVADVDNLDAFSYRLRDDSPCIDAGNLGITSGLAYDLAGERRLSGRQIDMGAYEFDNGAPVEESPIIHVAADGDDDGDGLTWDKATTLGHALKLADTYIGNAVIWLKAGTYVLSESVNADKLEIYGGFDGTETNLIDRDWHANPTIIDGGGSVSPFRNVALESTVSTVLDGLIVQNGINHNNANGNGNGGAAILTSGAQVRNCIFRNNRTRNGKNGAAIHCHLGNVRIENSLFVNNTSSGNGGAVQVGGGVTATVIHCTFANNTSAGPGGAFGLGNETSNLNVYNTIAYHNTGKGTYSSYGQNASVDGGGKVVSKSSAIESESKKFTDGDDDNHMSLSDAVSPLFENPSSVCGYVDDENLLAEANAASYRLTDGSPCIDAGDDNYASVSVHDLDRHNRLVGTHADMGAYEYDAANAVEDIYKADESVSIVFYKDGNIFVPYATQGRFAVYTADGKQVYSTFIDTSSYTMKWDKKGLFIVNYANRHHKFIAD